jgi:hypothetical protein
LTGQEDFFLLANREKLEEKEEETPIFLLVLFDLQWSPTKSTNNKFLLTEFGVVALTSCGTGEINGD